MSDRPVTRGCLVGWERAEAAIGTRLPADCKEYVHWFGHGDFDEYLIICVPGVENSNTEPAVRLAHEHDGARPRKRIDPGASPRIPLFPEPGGWLPWGFTPGGDGLYWVTSGAGPDHWTIAGRPGCGSDFGCFDGNFTEFRDTVEMPFVPEAGCDLPVPFEPDTGQWRAGGTGECSDAQGRFESE
ncbi:hypothetical protein [Streptomyces sp. NPDC005009]